MINYTEADVTTEEDLKMMLTRANAIDNGGGVTRQATTSIREATSLSTGMQQQPYIF